MSGTMMSSTPSSRTSSSSQHLVLEYLGESDIEWIWNSELVLGASSPLRAKVRHTDSSVQFSHSVVSDSLWPHGLQHTRLPCLSPTARAYLNLCPRSQWCHPTISSCRPHLLLPSIFPSIRVFSNESVLRIRWPKYWSFSFSISPSMEHPGLISFRMDWLYLLVVQGKLKSLFQHHSSKASVLRHSAFFIVQLSHPYMTTGKTIALTRQTFIGKVMSLFFNMRSMLVSFSSKGQASFFFFFSNRFLFYFIF